jgi:excinuclease ABC subunit B
VFAKYEYFFYNLLKNMRKLKEKLFKLNSKYSPKGDQPKAIEQLVEKINSNKKHTTLLGATGTGKTFTIANVIEKVQRPTLILAHNKTLAAQLCSEFKEFFPDNAVSYFVSYYDYYQPEAYVPATDTYIEKDSSINEEINKFRHAATTNLLSRRDVIIVATVSCIYGLGSVEDYSAISMDVSVGETRQRDKMLRHLTDMQYSRAQLEFKQGMFNVLGDVVEVFPPSSDNVYQIEFFGDEIDRIAEYDSFTGEIIAEHQSITIFPAKHDVTTQDKIEKAVDLIRTDLAQRYKELKAIGKNIEAERLKIKTEYDIEMLEETGYCNGIENYTRYLNQREPGSQPATLIDYFPDDFLMVIDESHITVPQFGGMYEGNRSRKNTLIEHGFRMPSAHDNRPLNFSEFEGHMHQVCFVSATPGKYEINNTDSNDVVEQIIRPTGLLDPVVEVRSTTGQVDDVYKESMKVIKKGQRALITTLTKKSAEALTDYMSKKGVKVRYLHSDIDTIERIDILRDLREGVCDVVIGINLLREGLDLPEVSFVGILDADKQGFLRSRSALLQTIGRAARNQEGYVVMYGEKITDAMSQALDETSRRREIQAAHNKLHGITPQTIKKAIKDIAQTTRKGESENVRKYENKNIPVEEQKRLLHELEMQMDLASRNMEFEKAAELRDEVEILKTKFNLK